MQSVKKYKSIIKLKKKFDLNDFDLISNYGLFSGETNLFKTLTMYELLKQTSTVKGDVIEFGLYMGNNSLLIKKILNLFNIKKKLILLDHFKGLIHFEKNEKKVTKKYKNTYKGNINQILGFLNFFKFRNFKIINKDASLLYPGFFKKQKFSLAYFDMDLYLPTIKALNSISGNISKGGYIVFDEGLKKFWKERIAIKEFLKNNNSFKKISLSNTMKVKKPILFNPDVILKKIK